MLKRINRDHIKIFLGKKRQKNSLKKKKHSKQRYEEREKWVKARGTSDEQEVP